MNQMTQSRKGNMPMAQNNNTQARCSFRKRLGALALLAALVMVGGKAWGQVTWYGTISDNSGLGYIHYTTGTTITITGNVQLKAPLLVWSGQIITIQTDGGGPYTISAHSSFSGIDATMIRIGWTATSIGALTINGGGKLTIDAGGTSYGSRKCIDILANSACTINGTTIINGYYGTGGAAAINSGTLTCTDCIFGDNTSSGTQLIGAEGGAVKNNSGAYLTCTRCNFYRGLANRGGAIFNEGVTIIYGGTFNNNTTNTDNGGAIVNTGSGVLNVSQAASFTNNSAVEKGGAIFNDSNITPLSSIFNGCTFEGNQASGGGAIYNSTTIEIQDCTFDSNKTRGTSNGNFGGGILNDHSGTLKCNSNCEFKSNEAYVGGGICSYGKVTVQDCTFDSNKASGSAGGNGGGFYQSYSNTSNPSTITSCEFKNNQANAGGAIFSSGYLKITEANGNPTLIHDNEILSGGTGGGGILTNGTVDMEAGKIYHNVTNIPNGGGVYVAVISHSGNFSLKGSSAIYSNSTTGYGGGVYVTSGATFTMSGSSYVGSSGNGNSAVAGGGIYTQGITNINGGNIQYNTISGSGTKTGAGVYVAGGTTTMSAGAIHDHSSITHGGGVFVNAGTFTMSTSGTGEIYKNTVTGKGGGVYVASGATFNLNGGNIGKTGSGNNNSAGNSGGGVYSEGTFAMTNGIIVNNSATVNGGGVYTSGTFSMSNGSITSNTATSGGGGIYLASGTVNMSAGEIISNTAAAGGGVYQAGGTFNMTGGRIGKPSYANNASSNTGGGVNLAGGTFNMSGGSSITNNTSVGFGGGVYKTSGTLSVTGTPVIKDNTRSGTAQDVYLNGGSSLSERIVLIGTAGLQCGAEIGIYKTGTETQIVQAQGSNAAANANYAMRNGFFFDDRNSNAVRSKTTSPYYDVNSANLYLVANGSVPTTWNQTTASGYSVSGNTITISSAAGLAYLANQVNSGAETYSGKTVLLSADISLSGKEWVPIGGSDCEGSSGGFKGVFNGQGHTITDLTINYPYKSMGLFGYVNGGTIKNVMLISSTLTAAGATHLGGLVGELAGSGTVYNCMAAATLSGTSTNKGALVGKITSGTLKNCYANSNDNACGSGTATNCYVRKVSGGSANNMGQATNVGSSGSTTGTFTQTVTPYLYKHADNRVGSTPLLTLLNQWVDNQSSPADLAHWTRTMASPINGDYPILMYDNLSMTCVAKDNGGDALYYRTTLGSMLGTYNGPGDNIYFWGVEANVGANTNGDIYFAENAVITSSNTIQKAHVGITLDHNNGSAGVHWHMFSPALSNAPLGVNYTDNTEWPFDFNHPTGMPYYLFTQKNESNATYGYFPSHEFSTSYPSSNTSATSYYSDWDYYCYYEKEYHWINFKRNSNSHWHEDGNHDKITYTNESTMTQGKGYLVATTADCLLEAKGTLNQGAININVTKNGAYRTGYNFLGNPYLSYFDFDAFASYNGGSGNDNRKLWSGNSVSNASYIILDKNGYTSYAYGSSSNPFGANRYLHPHQGFMIVVEGDATKAYFTNAMRDITHTAAFRDDHIDYPLVNLIATEEDGNRDITTIEVGRPDRGGAFKYYDMHLGKGCLYTHYEDQDYAIVFTQPEVDQVSVRFETDEDANYTMTWDTENGEFSYLHLIDNITGSDIDCLQDREYRFTSKVTDYKSRFKLVFGYTGVDENEEDGPSTGSGTFAFMMGDELVINGPSTGSGTALLQMFDMTGRMVMQQSVSGTQTTVSLPDLTAGVYVLRLSDRNGSRVQKIVIE